MSRFFLQLSSILAAILILPSCQTLQFYGQAINGEMEILRKSRASDSVIADPDTSPDISRQLEKVERMRRFAMDHLALPADECFGKYADIGRPHVVWVIYATPEFSMEPKTWSYPVVGKMDYRGYFRERDAENLADQLRRDGHDVYVGGVDAFSTLGWFHDPVLNTFINYPDIHLAENHEGTRNHHGGAGLLHAVYLRLATLVPALRCRARRSRRQHSLHRPGGRRDGDVPAGTKVKCPYTMEIFRVP